MLVAALVMFQTALVDAAVSAREPPAVTPSPAHPKAVHVGTRGTRFEAIQVRLGESEERVESRSVSVDAHGEALGVVVEFAESHCAGVEQHRGWFVSAGHTKVFTQSSSGGLQKAHGWVSNQTIGAGLDRRLRILEHLCLHVRDHLHVSDRVRCFAGAVAVNPVHFAVRGDEGVVHHREKCRFTGLAVRLYRQRNCAHVHQSRLLVGGSDQQ